MNIIFQENISQDQAFDWEKIIVETFSDSQITKVLTIEKNANIKYIAIVENSKVDIQIDCKENSNCELKSIHISNDWEKIWCKINSHLAENEAKSNLYMLSLIGENWDIDVDWWVIIKPGVSKVSGHLLEENVVLWKKVKINHFKKKLHKKKPVLTNVGSVYEDWGYTSHTDKRDFSLTGKLIKLSFSVNFLQQY